MTDTKISELPVATAIASPDVAPIVQGGVTKQADVSLFNNPDATVTLHSSGDDGNPSTFTANNSGLRQVDVNGVEMGRIWFDGSNEDIFITGRNVDGSSLPPGIPFTNGQNVVVGSSSMMRATAGAARNAAVGTDSLFACTSGRGNTAMGNGSLATITDGNNNVAIGIDADVAETSAVEMVLIGVDATAGPGVTSNAIAIGSNAQVSVDNTAVIGNSLISDVYCGGVGNAILHGKGDAIVFPDSDPHVAGAAYWVLGVLTKSAG